MRATAFLAAVLILFGGCSSDPQETAATSLQRISEIRSGELSLDVGIAPTGEDETTGFRLEGVFSLPEASGEIPEADLLYTQRTAGAEGEARFIADGESVFVEIDGQRTELPPDEVDDFAVAGSDGGDSVFSALEVERWFPNPEIEENDDEIMMTGELDVVAALNDIFEVARSFGGSLDPIEGAEAEIVTDSVRDARAEIVSGAEDGLLRHVEVEIDFGVTDEDLSSALGPLAGATFTLDLTISNVNEPVDVE